MAVGLVRRALRWSAESSVRRWSGERRDGSEAREAESVSREMLEGREGREGSVSVNIVLSAFVVVVVLSIADLP